MQKVINSQVLRETVIGAVESQQVTDIHTHLFSPDFGGLLLWGVDELITYHYLVAEVFRSADISYEEFWAMTQTEQADLIWQTLFIQNSPISESCRGVVTTLKELGLDLASRDLQNYREYFACQKVEDFIDIVFDVAKVKSVVMTNDPFDSMEQPIWLAGRKGDPRFRAALRIDPLLNDYVDVGCDKLSGFGYETDLDLSEKSLSEIRRFLSDWIDRMKPNYMAVSLPPEFKYPENSSRGKVIKECVLPISLEYNVPFALMIGVTRAVNPQLRMAGDGMAKADLTCLENLLGENPKNKFLTTLLSRENQHELCVIARKFPNLMVFGCWWFMNNPSLVDEITRERLELLGLSIIPQHSDARILDQLIYKWKHSRQIISKVLVDKYQDLLDSGWLITQDEIGRDVAALLGGNFEGFLQS
ncbi:TPA: glucuronate isomerase [Candidatus Poribacteria bacterium]|nr:glucuronate isomerase [Candidatus Poribacteria bacterium]|tara:strand:+ start:202 stop:1452 length:1251 start_codon:yes stop_codon:yes gene_type:complete